MGEDADPVSALGNPDRWLSVFSLPDWWRGHGHGASCLDPCRWWWVWRSSCLLCIQVMLLKPHIRFFLGEYMGPYSIYPRLPAGANMNPGEIVSFGIQSTVGQL